VRQAAIALLLLLSLSTAAIASPPQPIAGLDWLAGKTWVASPNGGLGKVAHIDTRYQWSSTGNFVQFETKFVEQNGAVNMGYSGMFYLDPKNGPSVWYADMENTIVTGYVALNDTGMTMFIGDGGKHYKVDITRTSPTSYRWQLFSQQNAEWVQSLQLDFVAAS